MRLRLACLLLAVALASLAALPPADAAAPPAVNPLAKLPPVFGKRAPESLDDLRAIERHVEKVLAHVTPAIVCVRVGAGSGTGVIVSKDGLVLTAGHVSGAPGRDCTLIFPDGKTARGKTLGFAPPPIDVGMIQIVEKDRTWPSAEIGRSADLKAGTWCIARGHPGGFKKGRDPVVRVGRVLNNGKSMIMHDCALVGGDSGGPLFDMTGKVIGIQSNIGPSIQVNNAVPIDVFRTHWDKLVKSEVFGVRPVAGVFLGVMGDPDAAECKLTSVTPGSPAAKAGLKAGDVVLKFGGEKVARFADLGRLVRAKKAGDEVEIEVQRDEEKMTLKVTLGKQ